MTTAAETFARGVAARTAGDERAAAGAFLMAFALAPDVPAHRSTAFDVLNVLDGYAALPAGVIAALEHVVRDPSLDIQPLSLVARNLIRADNRLPILQRALAGDEETVERALDDAEWLLTHRLLLPVLARAVNISPEIENIFTILRRHLCTRVTQKHDSVLLTTYRDSAIALTMQCITNRYVWQESPEETEALEILAARNDAASLLIRAAYRPLTQIQPPHADALPAPLAALWQAENDESNRAQKLSQLTPLADGLSATMRAQYEAYPYPRWREARTAVPLPLLTILQQAMPTVSFDAALEKDIEILVAGCGTGRTAINLASGLSKSRVLAVDISRTSLAYAERMADALGAGNITFGVADILKLDTLGKQFDYIDCGGVLHHMADPGAGLKVLRKLLRPHGVMALGLYSERGRQNVVAAQQFAREHGYSDSPEDMRAFRAAILALPANDPCRVDTHDFYTLDGLHDLVFNAHESRASPAAMKTLLASCGLSVIGVNLPAQLGGAAFKHEHPDPTTWADLDLWEHFEAHHPQVFTHMINVWARPVDPI